MPLPGHPGMMDSKKNTAPVSNGSFMPNNCQGMVPQNGGMMMMTSMNNMKHGFVVPTNVRMMPPNSDTMLHNNEALSKKKVLAHRACLLNF
jgi:hypothetical protein